TFEQQRFRYNLARVAELLDCVRASLRAEAGSPRPGHAFITFKELENKDLQPIGPASIPGTAFSVPRGDHVHALLPYRVGDDPQEGDRYLIFAATVAEGLRPIPSPGPNPWAKNVGSIATWNGRTWDYTAPDDGTAVFVEDEQIAYLFLEKETKGKKVEGTWIPFLATPTVAAGKGLRADGAILSVGEGEGLKVNEDTVDVVFEGG